MEKLALYGGNKTKMAPYGWGYRFGKEELENLKEALDQNTLFYWYGKKVKQFAAKFAGMYGVNHCVTTSSGTAALHVALGTLGVTAGDEVITSPVTDMGTVIGILFQNAVPVFTDLDPHTYNMDAKSVEEKITEKTKVILVVHLAGNAADMDAIMAVAHRHNIKVIEDCAQSYLTYYKGKLAGTIGDIGCFSVNDFKQISAGDGGMLIMNDEELYKKALRFADKNYNRLPDAGAIRDVEFLAPNYRMNELTGAVGLAQLDRLEGICKRRNEIGEQISRGIENLPGVEIPKVLDGCKSSYWFYLLRINEEKAGVGRNEFADALAAEGISCGRGYIPTCVYEYDMFTKKNAYPGTKCPFDCQYYNKEISYGKGLCPEAEKILDTSIKLPISEFYNDQDVSDIIAAFKKISAYYAK